MMGESQEPGDARDAATDPGRLGSLAQNDAVRGRVRVDLHAQRDSLLRQLGS